MADVDQALEGLEATLAPLPKGQRAVIADLIGDTSHHDFEISMGYITPEGASAARVTVGETVYLVARDGSTSQE